MAEEVEEKTVQDRSSSSYSRASNCNCSSHSNRVGKSLIIGRIEDCLFALAFLAVVWVLRFPMEKIAGNPVPAVIFKSQPATFHCYLMVVIGAFFWAACFVHIRERSPRLARYYRLFSLAALAVSFALLLWAAAVSSGLFNNPRVLST